MQPDLRDYFKITGGTISVNVYLLRTHRQVFSSHMSLPEQYPAASSHRKKGRQTLQKEGLHKQLNFSFYTKEVDYFQVMTLYCQQCILVLLKIKQKQNRTKQKSSQFSNVESPSIQKDISSHPLVQCNTHSESSGNRRDQINPNSSSMRQITISHSHGFHIIY